MSLTLALLLISAPVRPELAIQRGHADGVYSARFTPDGRYLVSSGLDHAIRIWDLSAGLEIGSLQDTAGKYTSLAVSADGKFAMAGEMFANGTVWNIADGKPRCNVTFNSNSAQLYATQENTFVAVPAGGGPRLVVDPQTCTASIGPSTVSQPMKGMILGKSVLQPDGNWIGLQNSFDNRTGIVAPIVFVRVGPDGKALPPSPPIPVSSDRFALSPDGERVLLDVIDSKESRHLELYDARTWRKIRAISAPIQDENAALVILPDNKRAITSQRFNGRLHAWDLDTGKELWSVPAEKGLWELSLSADATLVSGATSEGGLFVWDVQNGELVRDFETHVHSVSDVGLTDGDRLLALKSQGREVTVWDLSEGKIVHVLPVGHEGWDAMATQRKGSAIVVGGKDEFTLNVFDAKSGLLTRTLAFQGKRCKGMSFSPDEKTLFVYTYYDQRDALMAVDFATGKTLAQWDADEFKSREGPLHVAQSLDGSAVAFKVQGADTWRAFDQATWQPIAAPSFNAPSAMPAGFAPINSRLPDNTFFDLTRSGLVKRDVATGAEVRKLFALVDFYSDLTVTQDGRYVILAATDGLVRFFDTRSMNLVASFAAIDGAEPLIFTPDNEYKAGKVARGVAFRVGRAVYPFESFDLKLNRPDIVLQRLGIAPKALIDVYEKAHQKRLQRMGYTEAMLGDDFTLPTAEVKGTPPLTTKDKVLKLAVHAADANTTLDRLFVQVNGVTLNGSAGFSIKDRSTADEIVDVELSPGLNKIQVSALNARGIESARQNLRVRYDGPAVPAKRWVVAIGVSRYVDADKNLSYAAKDARDFAAAMTRADRQFASTQALVIVDDKATRANILAARKVLQQSKVDDQVIVFYAGHGLLDDKLDYFLGTHDMNFDRPADAGLPYEALEALLDGIPARHKLLFIDACHSGEIDRDTTALVASVASKDGAVKNRGFRRKATSTAGVGLENSFELMRALFADLRRSSGAVVISSASGTQFALESAEWKNGVFTFAVLDGLKHKKIPVNGANQVTVSKLRDYVIAKVQTLTNGQQTPTARQDQVDDDFVIQ